MSISEGVDPIQVDPFIAVKILLNHLMKGGCGNLGVHSKDGHD